MTTSEFARSVRLTWNLAGHEIATQRKESFLGLLWVVLWPLVQAGGFLLAFQVIRGGPTGLETVLATYLGVLAWTTASSILVSNLGILKSNRDMITQVVFSFSILPVVDVTVKYLFFLIQFAIALALWLLVGPSDQWLLVLAYLPLYLIAFYLVLLATAWIASILGVALPDLSYVLPPVLVLLLVLSPVFQRQAEALPWSLRVFNEFNPLSLWVQSLYSTIDVTHTGPSAPVLFFISAIVAVAVARYLVAVFYREMAKVI